jgi:hypothetical protein
MIFLGVPCNVAAPDERGEEAPKIKKLFSDDKGT